MQIVAHQIQLNDTKGSPQMTHNMLILAGVVAIQVQQSARGHGPGQRAFWGWAQARAQWPMMWVDLCPMALSYVLWRCPMSYGPVLCPMALSYVLWPTSHGPVLCPVSQIHIKWFEARPNGKPTRANGVASWHREADHFGTVLGPQRHSFYV